MNKKTVAGIKGFVIGVFVLALIFVITVLIMASCNGRSFTEEISSWGQEQTLPEDTNTDKEQDSNNEQTEQDIVLDAQQQTITIC